MLASTFSKKWKSGGWIRLLSGRTLRPSMGSRFVASWIFYLRDSLASRFPVQANGRLTKTRGISGRTSSDPSSQFDLGLSFSKTSKELSRQSLEVKAGRTQLERPFCSMSSASWKESVIGARGEYSARLKSAQATGESGSSSSAWPTAKTSSGDYSYAPGSGDRVMNLQGAAKDWPTPSAANPQDGESPETWLARREELKAKGANGNGCGTPLGMAVQMWTTPQAHDVTERGSGQQPTSAAGNACLARDARLWPTPDVPNGGRKPSEKMLSGDYPTKVQIGIANAAEAWATPRVTTNGGISSQGVTEHKSRLEDQTAMWSTPTSRDEKNAGAAERAAERCQPLSEQACNGFPSSHPAPEKSTNGPESSPPDQTSRRPSRRQLNPDFVDWLMLGKSGIGWTDCGPLVTESSRTP